MFFIVSKILVTSSCLKNLCQCFSPAECQDVAIGNTPGASDPDSPAAADVSCLQWFPAPGQGVGAGGARTQAGPARPALRTPGHHAPTVQTRGEGV